MSAFVGNLKTNLGQKYFCVCNHIYTKSPCLPLPQVDAKPCLLQPLWALLFPCHIFKSSGWGILGLKLFVVAPRLGASLVAQSIKNLPAMPETQVWSLGWEDPLEKEVATHSSILAWEIPRRIAWWLQSMGLQRVRHDLVSKPSHGSQN